MLRSIAPDLGFTRDRALQTRKSGEPDLRATRAQMLPLPTRAAMRLEWPSSSFETRARAFDFAEALAHARSSG
jgi:hypothetical protein